jgi:polyisoprenoid-binding protein YceI
MSSRDALAKWLCERVRRDVRDNLGDLPVTPTCRPSGLDNPVVDVTAAEIDRGRQLEAGQGVAGQNSQPDVRQRSRHPPAAAHAARCTSVPSARHGRHYDRNGGPGGVTHRWHRRRARRGGAFHDHDHDQHERQSREHKAMTITRPTRLVGGVVQPAPGTWEIDPGHSDVAFTGRHFMITEVRGRFTDIAGTITIAEDLRDSRVEVEIGMASVESGSAARDDHLRSPDHFDVENFPKATFRSRRVEWQGTLGVVHGDLTIHGITRELPLEVSFEGHARDPWGGDRAIISAQTTVNREDFGVGWNVALETGGLLVSKDVLINIEIETLLAR